MPIAFIHLIEGRDAERKRAMIAAVSQAISETLGAPIESVRVVVQEIPSQDWGIAGKTAKELGR